MGLVCLGFCKRFVESVKKTNYILTFLHVFVFVVPAAGEFLADEAFLTPSTHTLSPLQHEYVAITLLYLQSAFIIMKK